jgi:SAM-dependent methyltransferase
MAQARSMSSPSSYVHGYGGHERARLQDQAGALLELLHADVAYPPGSTVLEVGCGIGAQTVTLVARSPGARITSFDLSVASLPTVRRRLGAAAHDVALLQADLFRPPFAPASFDHLFVCFVLEHLPRPLAALRALGEMLRPGGTMTVVEGDHGSVCFHPDSPAARAAIDCQVQLQRAAGGDACIGRRLYPLLRAADLDDVRVTPLLVYADASRPDLVDAFTRSHLHRHDRGVSRRGRSRRTSCPRIASTPARAPSTARPTRTACSVTPSSRVGADGRPHDRRSLGCPPSAPDASRHAWPARRQLSPRHRGAAAYRTTATASPTRRRRKPWETAMIEYQLEHVFSFTGLGSDAPDVVGMLPEGLRVNFRNVGGEVTGPQVRGRLLPTGGDWVVVRADGVAFLDARVTIETDDGALIFATYPGVCDFGPDGQAKFLKSEIPAVVPMRTTPRFATGHPKYAWLNRLCCVAVGEFRPGEKKVVYDVYAVR